MSYSVTEPSSRQKWVAGSLVITYAVITMIPLLWIMMTSFKTPPDSISYPPKVFFEPSVEGYVNLFTTRTRVSPEKLESLPPPANFAEEIVRNRDMVIAGPSKFGGRFLNSVIIGFGSTFLSIFLGTLAAYAFSRFRIPLADDLLFFILSTRMMPPIAVAIPIFLMYRFYKVVLPQAATGIASTAIFCLIFAWNEYAFAVLLTSGTAQTAPPFIPTIIGVGGLDWPAIAAGATLFLLPVMIFTVMLRKHLLRGITFGAVRK